MTSSPIAVLTKEDTVKGTSIVPIDTYYRDGESLPYRLPPLGVIFWRIGFNLKPLPASWLKLGYHPVELLHT